MELKRFMFIYSTTSVPYDIWAQNEDDAIDKIVKGMGALPEGLRVWPAPKEQDFGDTNINDL